MSNYWLRAAPTVVAGLNSANALDLTSVTIAPGGGQMFLGEEEGKRVNIERAEQLTSTGAAVIGTACPFCQTMFRDALTVGGKTPPKLLDIAQIAAASLKTEA